MMDERMLEKAMQLKAVYDERQAEKQLILELKARIEILERKNGIA